MIAHEIQTATNQPVFSERLLAWFDVHGRHDLPWQQPRTAYRVWISEVMLQQTQVATVIDYFNRFIQRFPQLGDLAAAPLDDVLALWSGLGYYARARNLHAAARVMAAEGIPDSLVHWLALPGVGASTAAAIMAQAFDAPATILDGNVKRVMARHAGIDTPIEQASTIQALYHVAKSHTPTTRLADYTQAIMDLGATLCTRGQANCARCPVSTDCVAYLTDQVAQLPTRRARKPIPTRRAIFLHIEDDAGRLMLIRRPPSGIWGGLWCLPEYTPIEAQELQQSQHSESAARQAMLSQWSFAVQGEAVEIAAFEHRFTHYLLNATIERVRVGTYSYAQDTPDVRWFHVCDLPAALPQLGLPKPIARFLADCSVPLEE
ncbi:MAG TPA: A/G-specific adenine glycosylase [Halothiobacillus sp.]|nr:MAG: A/G-specific adenine glycosylase [Halothiobacillus sp. 20-54-6]HQT43245.1 A/G-specific adenine glycosylase [Halothiobacillus sp.]